MHNCGLGVGEIQHEKKKRTHPRLGHRALGGGGDLKGVLFFYIKLRFNAKKQKKRR